MYPSICTDMQSAETLFNLVRGELISKIQRYVDSEHHIWVLGYSCFAKCCPTNKINSVCDNAERSFIKAQFVSAYLVKAGQQ